MSIEVPANSEQEKTPEQEYREQLTAELIAEAQGSVGIYTSTGFDAKEGHQRLVAMSERNPGAPIAMNMRNSSGWGEYGERKLSFAYGEDDQRDSRYGDNRTHPLLEPETRFKGEEARFVETDNGNVEVRYIFSSDSYVDGMGRRGNALNVGFTLSKEKAASLEAAINADPTFMRDVVKAQVLSLGITESKWNVSMGPKRPEEGHALLIVKPDVEPTLVSFADKKDIMPTQAAELNQSIETTTDAVSEMHSYGKDFAETDVKRLTENLSGDDLESALASAIEELKQSNETGEQAEWNQGAIEGYQKQLDALYAYKSGTSDFDFLSEKYSGNELIHAVEDTIEDLERLSSSSGEQDEWTINAIKGYRDRLSALQHETRLADARDDVAKIFSSN